MAEQYRVSRYAILPTRIFPPWLAKVNSARLARPILFVNSGSRQRAEKPRKCFPSPGRRDVAIVGVARAAISVILRTSCSISREREAETLRSLLSAHRPLVVLDTRRVPVNFFPCVLARGACSVFVCFFGNLHTDRRTETPDRSAGSINIQLIMEFMNLHCR
jgi:hypothetical protein